MSCQPRPQPQASGTAASTASRGTATKSPTRNRSRRPLGSGSTSGPGAWRVVVPGQPQQRLEAVESRLEPRLPWEDALPVRPEDLQIGRPEIAVDGVGRGEQAGRPPAVVHGADRERAGGDAVDLVA